MRTVRFGPVKFTWRKREEPETRWRWYLVLMPLLNLILLPFYLLLLVLYTLFWWLPVLIYGALGSMVERTNIMYSQALWKSPPDHTGLLLASLLGIPFYLLSRPLYFYLRALEYVTRSK